MSGSAFDLTFIVPELKTSKSFKSITRKFKTADGTTYIIVSFDRNGEVSDVFLTNKHEIAEVIGRFISTALQSGLSLEEVLNQLSKVKGEYAKQVAEQIKAAIEDFKVLSKKNDL